MTENPRLSGAGIPQELLELQRRYVLRLPGHLDAIVELFQTLSGGRWEPGAGKTLHRMVHSLTGTSGTFGLGELSLAARQLESHLATLLHTPTPPIGALWPTLEASLAQLTAMGRNVAPPEEEASPPTPEPPVRPLPGTLIHLITNDHPAAEPLRSALTLDGFRVAVFDSSASFVTHSNQPNAEAPSAVVLDMADNDNPQTASAWIAELGLSNKPGIALVVALNEGHLPMRIAVARAGARCSLPRPLEPEHLIEVLNDLTGRSCEAPWRVLLVDDEAMALQAHAIHLRHAGMEVRTLTDPMQTLDEVQRFDPDVLVLDVYMPEVHGPELAAALRESNVSPHLSIVFLSAETDMSQQLAALNLGGDDFLIKPVQPSHLVAAVTARARRARKNQNVQKRLETTVYERQREHLALNEHAIVSMADASGNITYANDLFCEVSGYKREEILGQNHRLIRSDEHPSDFFQDMWATITSGRVWQSEIRCKRRDGSLFWVECTITPFLDTSGQPYQYVSIQTDISHLKAAEATLGKKRDMQRMISMTAARLMAAPASQTTEAVNAALQASGELLDASHALLFRFSRDGGTMKNTHLWHSSALDFDASPVKRLQLRQFAWVSTWFNKDGMVVIPDVSLLPKEATEEKSVLEGIGCQALIAFPMIRKGQVAGLIAYSSTRPMPSWTLEVSELLGVLSEVIGSALARQYAEMALRDSESRLSFLVSSSPVVIYTRSAKAPFALSYVSPNASDLMALDPKSFTNDADFWITQIHSEDRAKVQTGIEQMLDGQVHQHEYRLRNGAGGYQWVQDQLRLAQDETTGEAELVGYWMDITERKRIEAELSRFNHALEDRVAEQTQSIIETERFARATLDALEARVAILDEHGTILAVNRAWAEASAPAEGSNYIDQCDALCGASSNGTTPIANGLNAVLQGDSDDYLHEYAGPQATDTRWYVCRVKRFPEGGKLRVVVSHEDITAMKVMERQQMRSQRMESLGTLAGGVAHDLNNSLAPILMGMGILQDQYPEENKLIGMIHNSAKRGADMVRQLLAFAKGVDGQRVAVLPSELVTELESLMKGSFPKNIDVQVSWEIPMPWVLGDATQLHQILLNLCVNARDAMLHGGTLTLEATTVEVDELFARSVSEATPGRYVCFRVADTGDGIPPDILDRIFDPFFTTKSKERGTGLGLSTVLGIIKGHGGFVQITSTLGQGSAFAVHLPVAQDTAEKPDGVDTSKPFKGQGETILFVDDEPALQDVGQTVLKRLNFNPIIAVDGEDALIKTAENRASLKAIITDMHMPRMDGLAFVHAVRRTLPDIPIILASGRVDDSVARDFQALGVVTRLDKPFTEDQLAEKLGALLAAARENG